MKPALGRLFKFLFSLVSIVLILTFNPQDVYADPCTGSNVIPGSCGAGQACWDSLRIDLFTCDAVGVNSCVKSAPITGGCEPCSGASGCQTTSNPCSTADSCSDTDPHPSFTDCGWNGDPGDPDSCDISHCSSCNQASFFKIQDK